MRPYDFSQAGLVVFDVNTFHFLVSLLWSNDNDDHAKKRILPVGYRMHLFGHFTGDLLKLLPPCSSLHVLEMKTAPRDIALLSEEGSDYESSCSYCFRTTNQFIVVDSSCCMMYEQKRPLE